MTLSVDIDHRQGDFRLVARFEAGTGVTALFGPSGSGKTTLVNIIAGLIRPQAGRLAFDGETWFDAGRRVFLAPHRRRLGYVFQEGRLFPHLSVRGNLDYGRLFAPRSARYENRERVVELLGIGHLLARRPAGLSGGEKQRVAIGRALMASPRLLLMDEPLAALDRARRGDILPYIERLRAEMNLPIVYVSHAVEEVARLADTIVAFAGGRITGIGDAAAMLGDSATFAPDDRREAGALLDGRVAAHEADAGLSRIDTAAGPLTVPAIAAPQGTPVRLRIRAGDVMLATERPRKLSALNILAATIESISQDDGPTVTVRLLAGGAIIPARITRHSAAMLELAPGRSAYAIVKSVSFDRSTLAPGR